MNTKTSRLVSFVVALFLALGTSFRALAAPARSIQAQGYQAPLLSSNVYYVSKTGSDTNSGSSTSPFKTFAKAVSILQPGDTLQVMPGTYNEALILSKSGTASAPITVIGNGAVLDMQKSKTTGIKVSGSYLIVSNFEVTGAQNAGIGIPGKYVTVKNNIIHDNVTDNGYGTCGTGGSWSSALKVGVGGQNITIDNNKIYNNCGEGIAITRGVSVVVKNNTSYDNWAQNIYIDNSPYTTVQNNLVYCTGARLRSDGKRPSGIGLGEEYYSGWGAQMHDVQVSGNTVKDCGKGIGAYASQVNGTFTNITITRNSVPSGELRPISLSTSPNRNVVISYNTIYTDPYISDSAGVTLTGNIIGGNTTAPTATPQATQPPATSVVTNTPVPTSTPVTVPSTTPTSGSQATPTPTTVNNPSAPDAIFASSFESGSVSEWSGSSTGGGDLSVSPAAALVGANGMQVVINDTTAMYVNDGTPFAEPRYRVRFYFDPNSITMANGDSNVIFRGISGTSTVIVRVEFGFSGGSYQIRTGLISDGSAWTNTDWFSISDASHPIELDWRAATAAGANDGSLTLWIDGVQKASLTGIDNDTLRIDRARIGALAALDSGTSGTFFFDAFESRRQTYIGP